MKKAMLILAVAAIFVISARGQGFLNLNFESAYNLPGNPGNGEAVPATNALPDWTAYDGDLALSEIDYVSNFFGGAGTPVVLEGGSLALGGNFSAGLITGGSISQTGLVPGNAESLQFEASSPLSLEVALGGQNLPYSAISKGPGYTVYGANIPANMAGKTEALTFTMEDSVTVLDNIEFSTMSVPEPSKFALIGLGTILVGLGPGWKRIRLRLARRDYGRKGLRR